MLSRTVVVIGVQWTKLVTKYNEDSAVIGYSKDDGLAMYSASWHFSFLVILSRTVVVIVVRSAVAATPGASR